MLVACRISRARPCHTQLKNQINRKSLVQKFEQPRRTTDSLDQGRSCPDNAGQSDGPDDTPAVLKLGLSLRCLRYQGDPEKHN
jgi:hypothetical protein